MTVVLSTTVFGFWFLLTALLAVYLFITGWLLKQTTARHKRAVLANNEQYAARIEAETKLAEAFVRESELALAVTPLIEKTDWMTGRWAGRFDELVAAENRRNDLVVRARKSLFALPGVRKHIDENLDDVIPTVQGAPLS